MSNLPGQNPVDAVPPPGATQIPATQASIAKLWARVQELERRVAALER